MCVVWCCSLSSDSCFFCLLDSVSFGSEVPIVESLMPSGAVFCLRLPGADIDLELFESGFQRIFIPLFLASDFPLAIPQLPVEDLFRKSVVRHPHNMTCPSCLGPEKHGMYRLGAGLLKDFSVGYLSCHLMWRSLRKQLIWKWLSFLA